MDEPKKPNLTTDEEAKAEEAFINDPEDHVENPLVPEEEESAEIEPTEVPDADLPEGAAGSGNLETVVPDEPVNNESLTTTEDQVMPEEQPAEAAAPVVEPVAEPAPAAEPTPAPAAEPAAAPVADTPVAADAPKKKGGAGKIIALIIVLLLVIGGIVGAILFFNWHESPEKVQADALTKLFGVTLDSDEVKSIENGGATQISGKIVIEPKDVKASGIDFSKLALDIKSTEDGVNEMAESTLSYTMNGKDYKLSVAAAYIKGGKIYVKLSDLADIKNSVSDILTEASEDLSATTRKSLETAIGAAVDKADGQWMVITADQLGDMGKTYSCLTEQYEKVMTDKVKQDLGKAYNDNAFISFSDKLDKVSGAKDGLNYYTVKIDKKAAEAFGKAVEKIDYSSDFEKCFTDAELNSLEAEDDSEESELYKADIKVGVKSWSHDIEHVLVKGDEYSIDLTLSYDKQTVTAPSDAKTLREYGAAIYDAFVGSIIKDKDSIIEDICAEYRAYGSAYYSSCKEQYDGVFDQLKELSFDDFVDQMTKSISGPSHFDEDDDYDWDY